MFHGMTTCHATKQALSAHLFKAAGGKPQQQARLADAAVTHKQDLRSTLESRSTGAVDAQRIQHSARCCGAAD